MWPFGPRPTVTMLGTVWPGTTLRFDAVGMASPDGHAVTYVAADAFTAVTLATSAVAPAGTPAAARSTSRLSPGWKVGPPRPLRVSRTRTGTTAWKPSAYQPVTSTTTWAAPSKLNRSIWPPAPSPTVTMLATVWPATTLTFEAVGWVAPAGHTVRYVAAVGSVTVTFRATATASAGMSAWPVTWSALV